MGGLSFAMHGKKKKKSHRYLLKAVFLRFFCPNICTKVYRYRWLLVSNNDLICLFKQNLWGLLMNSLFQVLLKTCQKKGSGFCKRPQKCGVTIVQVLGLYPAGTERQRLPGYLPANLTGLCPAHSPGSRPSWGKVGCILIGRQSHCLIFWILEPAVSQVMLHAPWGLLKNVFMFSSPGSLSPVSPMRDMCRLREESVCLPETDAKPW